MAVLGAAIGVIVLLAIVAIVVTDRATEEAPAAVWETHPVEVTGDPLPELTAADPDPAVGRQAPELRGAGLDGEPLEITADGTLGLLVFLAH